MAMATTQTDQDTIKGSDCTSYGGFDLWELASLHVPTACKTRFVKWTSFICLPKPLIKTSGVIPSTEIELVTTQASGVAHVTCDTRPQVQNNVPSK